MDEGNTRTSRRIHPLILPGVVVAVLFWLLDILVDVYVFHESEFMTQLLHPERLELWIRSLVAALILAFTFYASFLNERLRQANTELVRTVAGYDDAMAALNEAKTKYHLLVEQIPAAVYIWELGEGGRCVYISPQIERMLGFSVSEWLADPDLFFRQVHPEDREAAIAAENHSNDTGEPLSSEFRMQTRDGRMIWVHDQSFVLPNDENRSHLNQGLLMDITARKQAEEDLRRAKSALEMANHDLQLALKREKQLACTDGLTGLYNHRHFFELADREFQAAIRYRRLLSFLMFDMDHFKQVNDTYGHTVGDKLLAKVAQMAVTKVRASDVMARYGGDEFIVSLPQASAQQAFLVAARIQASVSEISMEIGREILHVSLSIGIAEIQLEPPDRHVEHVIQRADQALYQAKRLGRNRMVIFGQDQTDETGNPPLQS